MQKQHVRPCILLWGALLLLAATPACQAQGADVRISATEILGCGIFEMASASRKAGFTGSTVAADTVRGVHFTAFTDRVPGVLNTMFGFQYSINSTPRGHKLPIRSVIVFPEPGLQHPGGKIYRKSVEEKSVKIGRPDLHGYGFDEPWEIVPGEWVFEIWHGEAMLIRKTFVVEKVNY